MLYRDAPSSIPPVRAGGPSTSPDIEPLITLDPEFGPWIHLGEPRSFQWNRAELPITNLPPALQGLRILHLSDLHLRPHWYAQSDRLLARIADSNPDLILFTGDFVDNRHDCRPSMPSVSRFFKALAPPLGTFAIFGNHDQTRRTETYIWRDLLGPLPLTMIDEDRCIIERDGSSIELIGLPGLHQSLLKDEFLKGLPARVSDSARIVLSHYPEQIKRLEPLAPDVYLTGHTHGGQCCLPNGFPLITHDALPRRYATGIHHWKNRTWFVANRGFGFSGPQIRTFCPPEVIEIVLKEAR